MATHSNILAWRIPWTKEIGRLESMGSQRVGRGWATEQQQQRPQKWWLNVRRGCPSRIIGPGPVQCLQKPGHLHPPGPWRYPLFWTKDGCSKYCICSLERERRKDGNSEKPRRKGCPSLKQGFLRSLQWPFASSAWLASGRSGKWRALCFARCDPNTIVTVSEEEGGKEECEDGEPSWPGSPPALRKVMANCLIVFLRIRRLWYQKCGPETHHFKASTPEARLVARKVRFISEAGPRGRGVRGVRVDSCTRADSPHWQSMDKSFSIWREGVMSRNSAVRTKGCLEIAHEVVWAASSWLF